MESAALVKEVGHLVRQLRRSKGLSQEEYADLCGLHRTYIGMIERGEKTITIVTASKLASALGLTLSQFFRELEERST
jgi:transcriptional regulator with XRE-family HTH domain